MKTIKQDTVYVEFLLDSIKIPQNGSPPLRYSWFRFCAFLFLWWIQKIPFPSQIKTWFPGNFFIMFTLGWVLLVEERYSYYCRPSSRCPFDTCTQSPFYFFYYFSKLILIFFIGLNFHKYFHLRQKKSYGWGGGLSKNLVKPWA